MVRKTILYMLIPLALFVTTLFAANAALATTEHCPDGGTKVEAVGDELNDIVLPAGTLVCVKGSTEATGIVEADGQSSLFDILGNDHDVSYYVVYGEEEPSPSPTTTPSPSPSESVSPSPSSTSTPTPSETTPGPTTSSDTPTPSSHSPTSPAPPRTANTGLDAQALSGGIILLVVGLAALWYARKLKL